MNDEGTAPSLAAGAVPFLMWDEVGNDCAVSHLIPSGTRGSSLSAGEHSGS